VTSALPIAEAAAVEVPRRTVGVAGIDRVLGGGLVPGSLLLLAGEPGVGKSTLLLQVVSAVAAAGGEVLYVTAEESAAQVAMRARRLGIDSQSLLLLADSSCEAALAELDRRQVELLVVDSVQTMTTSTADAAAGSVSQVRAVAAQLQEVAKRAGVPVVLVGHVTKEGSIAGPKVLEHLVDVVLSLEGESGHDLRALRASKNRFGTVAELALFAMGDAGMEPVRNPSAWLLEDRQPGAAGSAVGVAVEGTAPLLVEVQALTAESALGTPRRVGLGFDSARLSLLLAVLERRGGVQLGARDVYVNIVGGLSVREPGLDLAVAAALVSSVTDRPLPARLAVFGEIGLLGEVRGVSRTPERAREAAALGFERVALPVRSAADDLALPAVPIATVADLVAGLAGGELVR
jgi:DNA repair protein RadA/Sms